MIRKIILLFVVCFCMTASAQEFISIRKLSNAQIKTIFDAQIQSMYIKDSSGNIHQIAQHVRRGTWLREGMPYGPKKESLYIVQHVDGGKYIARQGSTWYLADLGRDGYVDGERVDNLILERMPATYQYITVLGAKSTIAVMRAIEDKLIYKPLTYEDFSLALESGKTFDVLLPSQLPCPKCKGTGSLKERNQKGAATAQALSYRSIICSHCKASGKVSGEKRYCLTK